MTRRPGDHSDFLRRGEFADEEDSERFEAEHPEASMRRREFLGRTAALAGGASLATMLPLDTLVSAAARSQAKRFPLPSPAEMPLDTIVVLMMENRSFDHYFGWHPDADAKNTGLTYPDAEGKMLETFRLTPDFQGCQYVDPDHGWDGGRWQWNRGKNDRFVTGNEELDGSDEFAIGYYLKEDLGFIPHAADAYTLYDRWFTSVMASTWPNRHYLWGGQSGGEKGNGDPQDAVTHPEGLYPWETIDNRAAANGVSFRYYYSDLPFGGVYGVDTVGRSAPVQQFYADAAAGTLPSICFVDPPFRDGGGGNGLSADEHPHGDVRLGQAFMSDVAHAFMESPQYRRGAMFINYDEWGGFFDHVKPRFVPDDRRSSDLFEDFGMTGFRIPGVAISPFTLGGGVNHMTITHESILKLISYRFKLGYLTKRHRYASNIGRSFDFTRTNFDPPEVPDPETIVAQPCVIQRSEDPGAEAPHGEMAALETSGYLKSIGAKVYEGTPEQIFRKPDSVIRRYDASPRSR